MPWRCICCLQMACCCSADYWRWTTAIAQSSNLQRVNNIHVAHSKCYLLKIKEALCHFRVEIILIFILKLPDVNCVLFPAARERCKLCISCIIKLVCAGNLKQLGSNSLKEKCLSLCNLNSDLLGWHSYISSDFNYKSSTLHKMDQIKYKFNNYAGHHTSILKRITNIKCFFKFLGWPTIETKYWPSGEFAVSWWCSHLMIWSIFWKISLNQTQALSSKILASNVANQMNLVAPSGLPSL